VQLQRRRINLRSQLGPNRGVARMPEGLPRASFPLTNGNLHRMPKAVNELSCNRGAHRSNGPQERMHITSKKEATKPAAKTGAAGGERWRKRRRFRRRTRPKRRLPNVLFRQVLPDDLNHAVGWRTGWKKP
jgi:hypothetical protein